MLAVGLGISMNCFADSDQDFESKYFEVMDDANLAQIKKYQFSEKHKNSTLSEADKVEEKMLDCLALKTELSFYQLVNNNPDAYVQYMKKQGLDFSYNAEKFKNGIYEVDQKLKSSGCTN
ncbi:hypothetical protein OK024_09025 [Acinetobacter sp. UGAL515B_02]|nr:hypothetical protein [Acinetobacter sp. UGAL515B_02]WON79119.1 hypothetical protein OK024_09025 [Acinetobacter sp. UGAL515B_02]